MYPKIKTLSTITSSYAIPIVLCFRLKAIKLPTPITMYARSNNIEKLI